MKRMARNSANREPAGDPLSMEYDLGVMALDAVAAFFLIVIGGLLGSSALSGSTGAPWVPPRAGSWIWTAGESLGLLAGAVYMVWIVAVRLATRLTSSGIAQFRTTGWRRIEWSQVTDLKRRGNVLFITAGQDTIALPLPILRHKDELIGAIKHQVSLVARQMP